MYYLLYIASTVQIIIRLTNALYLKHYVKSVEIWIFFWFVFSFIRTEFGDSPSKYPYSVGIGENTDQKNRQVWTLFTQPKSSTRVVSANICWV